MPDHAPYILSTTPATWRIRVADEGELKRLSRQFREDPHVDKVDHRHVDHIVFLQVTFKNGYGAPVDPSLQTLARLGGDQVVEPSQKGRKGRKGCTSKTAYDLIDKDG